jgi:hypothetical protein
LEDDSDQNNDRRAGDSGTYRGGREGGGEGGGWESRGGETLLTEEVSEEGEAADDDASQLSSRGNVTVQLVLQSCVSMTFDDLRTVSQRGGRGRGGGAYDVLLSEIFGDGLCSESGDLDPDLGEGGGHWEKQHSVEEDVEGVEDKLWVRVRGGREREARGGGVPRRDWGGEM